MCLTPLPPSFPAPHTGTKGTETSAWFSRCQITVWECTVPQRDRSSLDLSFSFGEVDKCYAFDYIYAKVSTEEENLGKWMQRKQLEKSRIAKSKDTSEGWVLLFNSFLRRRLLSAVQLCRMLLGLWIHRCGLDKERCLKELHTSPRAVRTNYSTVSTQMPNHNPLLISCTATPSPLGQTLHLQCP